jgi:hypothetical protein
VSSIKWFINCIQVARPVDIRELAAQAYRKDAVWWPKHEKGRVAEGLGLEGLAELALNGMWVEKKPAKLLEADRGLGFGLESVVTMMKMI